jgi:hypothetical protein
MTPSDDRTIDNYLNATTVVVPTDSSQPFGNAGRNVARSYSLYQLDLGMAKAIKLSGESISLQFRAEASISSITRTFATQTPTASVAGFGQVRATFPARQIQFALRLIF